MDVTCTIQNNIHLSKLNIYVSRILGTHQNRFCRVTPVKFIRYLKTFHKANLDINKSLRLWVIMYTLLKFRTFRLSPYLLLSRQEREEATYYRYIEEVYKQCTYYWHYKKCYVRMFIFITNALHIGYSIRGCPKAKSNMPCW